MAKKTWQLHRKPVQTETHRVPQETLPLYCLPIDQQDVILISLIAKQALTYLAVPYRPL